MQEAAIGVDLGSTSIKGVLYVPAADRVAAVACERMPDPRPADEGRHEVDTEPVLAAAEAVLGSLAEAVRGMRLLGISFTGQMHGGLLLDGGGHALTPFVSWQDKRGDEGLIDWMRQRVPADAWADGGLHTGFLGTTAAGWAREGLNAAKMAGICEWVASSLLGVPLVADVSAAESWGLYAAARGQWRHEVIDAVGIPRDWLPPIVETGTTVGTAASRLGLPQGVPVRAGIGDTQACYIGSTCRENEVLVNFGTGSQVMWERRTRPRYPGTDLRYLPGGRWLVTGATLAGGRAYVLLADFVEDVVRSLDLVPPGRDELYERMNQMASTGSAGVTVRPLFLGSRWKGEDLHAEIAGLDPRNFRLQPLCAALVAGMAEELADVYRQVPVNERPHAGLVGAGNAFRRNPALQAAVCDAFHLPLRFAANSEEAAVGAAVIAAGLSRGPAGRSSA